MELLLLSWAGADKFLIPLSLFNSLGIPAFGFEGNVRNQEHCKQAVEAAFNRYGRIDILVNAVAGNFLASAENLSANGFRTVLDIDSVETFTMCCEALKYLKKGGPRRTSSTGGVILNISATLHYTAAWYQIHVSAAKAAVDATTRNLALDWGTDYDIKVNGIAPVPISATRGMRKLAPEEMTSKARDYMPLSKLGEKWNIAMAAVYLASEADKHIRNGSVKSLCKVQTGRWHYFCDKENNIRWYTRQASYKRTLCIQNRTYPQNLQHQKKICKNLKHPKTKESLLDSL